MPFRMVLSDIVGYYYKGFVRNVPTSVSCMVRGFFVYSEKYRLIFICGNIGGEIRMNQSCFADVVRTS